MDAKTVGSAIAALRRKAGMTQTDLANRLGISRSAVNSWEMSFSSPSLANIIEMTQLFHVSADYLLSLSDKLTLDISSLTNEEKEVVIRLVQCLEEKKKS
jgi:transcriptional regulator with XRE-family HTH domain